jgi:hypothetical protein
MVYEAFFIDYTNITTYDGSASQSSCWKDDSLLGVIVAMSFLLMFIWKLRAIAVLVLPVIVVMI